MKFWDSSAVVPLILDEAQSASIQAAYLDDSTMMVWWGTAVECASAIERRVRAADGETVANDAYDRLAAVRERWQEIEPSEQIRDASIRLLRVHDLRAADALQLAAALVAADGRPATLDFVCFDRRLAVAAQREGLRVVPPL